ncbi:MAG TPA: response regulator transcription factor [Bacteroidia bacterium]|nr:response regulator transcription factor [Bacteroidia bacterium]HNU32352.1 response regulator transcription factor [Bacteroidia bacterium]
MKNEGKPLRVICFDDNKNIRDSVSMLLSTTGNIKMIAGFDSCKNLLQDIEREKPDVIIMDIDMPEINGVQAVEILRKQYPTLPVMMLTGFEDDEKVFSSLCAGANGYILKNTKMDSLINQIQEVYEGGAPMTPLIARKVLNQFAKMQPQKTPDENYNLSNREKDVLHLLVQGKSYKMIADELHISYETVHSHIRKIYQKLQVNSVGEAVSKTISKNILKAFAALITATGFWQV